MLQCQDECFQWVNTVTKAAHVEIEAFETRKNTNTFITVI